MKVSRIFAFQESLLGNTAMKRLQKKLYTPYKGIRLEMRKPDRKIFLNKKRWTFLN